MWYACLSLLLGMAAFTLVLVCVSALLNKAMHDLGIVDGKDEW